MTIKITMFLLLFSAYGFCQEKSTYWVISKQSDSIYKFKTTDDIYEKGDSCYYLVWELKKNRLSSVYENNSCSEPGFVSQLLYKNKMQYEISQVELFGSNYIIVGNNNDIIGLFRILSTHRNGKNKTLQLIHNNGIAYIDKK